MWAPACTCEGKFLNWLKSGLKGGSVERAHPEEVWETRRPSQPLLMDGEWASPQRMEETRWSHLQRGGWNSRPEQAKLAPGTWRQVSLVSSHHHTHVAGDSWLEVCDPPQGDTCALWLRGPGKQEVFRVQIWTHTGQSLRALALSLFSRERSLSSVWTKAATPTGLTLTDFENAMQVTARSKKPIPMTCRVFNVTESQMRTCGGNCCLGKNAVANCAGYTGLPWPGSYKITSIFSKQKVFFCTWGLYLWT